MALILNLLFTVIHLMIKQAEDFSTLVQVAAKNLCSYVNIIRFHVDTQAYIKNWHKAELGIIQTELFTNKVRGRFDVSQKVNQGKPNWFPLIFMRTLCLQKLINKLRIDAKLENWFPAFQNPNRITMAHLHLGLLACWLVNTIRFQLKKKKSFINGRNSADSQCTKSDYYHCTKIRWSMDYQKNILRD
jgi:hypothetical protein